MFVLRWSSRYWLILVFFFQAEDGIRDLVRSRGLGDVYKRQQPDGVNINEGVGALHPDKVRAEVVKASAQMGIAPVSYTHLTLPTSDLV